MSSLREYAESLSREIKWHGNHNENAGAINLRAGDLIMLFENGSLRYISCGKNEIIRMIYSAVRDKNWLTINPLIEMEKIETTESSFMITFRSLYHSGEINFLADYVMEGKEDNSITLTMQGEALEKFEKNRIGFCVLHPIEVCAGRSCIIEHTDGSSEQSFFPEEISPNQVFRDIKSMKWMANRTNCRIDFEGDVFETEDQRNWTDASLKTYSTPLSIPFPVTLEKGTRIYQKVIFRTEGYFDVTEKQVNQTAIKLLPEEILRFPSVGICQSCRSSPLGKSEIKVLRSLRFDHYRVNLHLFENNWQVKADQAVKEASDLGCAVEFALFFDDNTTQQIARFIKWYNERRFSVSAILLFHKDHPSTPDHLASQVIPLLREAIPDIRIGTGTNANFAQLNRNRPGDTGNDYICFSVHPQEHASDNKTLVENLKGLEYTVKSAEAFAGRKGIRVSPVNIQRRFNANNSFIELPWQGPDMPPQTDCRLMSLFGACWTAGSLKYLFEAGADSITCYETAGERGIIQGESDSQWPSQFPSVKGMIFPVYYIFRFLLTNKNLNVIKSISSKPLIIDCLALTDGKQARIMLINFTCSVQSIKLDCCSALFRLRTLCLESYSEAASNYRWTGIDREKIIKSQSIFTLEPYSVNFITGWLRH
jgi:hypothetical protein